MRDKVLAAVLRAAPRCTKKDSRPFKPHITIANRDIPPAASTKALKTLAELGFHAEFPVDNIAIFERNRGLWQAQRVLSLE